MKEISSSVDWKLPENHVEQHNRRYMDQTLHLAFADTEHTFTGSGGALKPAELKRFRNYGLFKQRNNFIQTGGDRSVIDATLQFGAQEEVSDPETGIVLFKKKI